MSYWQGGWNSYHHYGGHHGGYRGHYNRGGSHYGNSAYYGHGGHYNSYNSGGYGGYNNYGGYGSWQPKGNKPWHKGPRYQPKPIKPSVPRVSKKNYRLKDTQELSDTDSESDYLGAVPPPSDGWNYGNVALIMGSKRKAWRRATDHRVGQTHWQCKVCRRMDNPIWNPYCDRCGTVDCDIPVIGPAERKLLHAEEQRIQQKRKHAAKVKTISDQLADLKAQLAAKEKELAEKKANSAAGGGSAHASPAATPSTPTTTRVVAPPKATTLNLPPPGPPSAAAAAVAAEVPRRALEAQAAAAAAGKQREEQRERDRRRRASERTAADDRRQESDRKRRRKEHREKEDVAPADGRRMRRVSKSSSDLRDVISATLKGQEEQVGSKRKHQGQEATGVPSGSPRAKHAKKGSIAVVASQSNGKKVFQRREGQSRATELRQERLMRRLQTLSEQGGTALTPPGPDAAPGVNRGVFWYIGTVGDRHRWRNPMLAGQVNAASSAVTSGDISQVFHQRLDGTCRFTSEPRKDTRPAWLAADLTDYDVLPTHYTMAHALDVQGAFPRNWSLRCSMDNKQWIILDIRKNDTTIRSDNRTATFKIPPDRLRWARFMRIVLEPGGSSSGTTELVLNALEFYGYVRRAAPPVTESE